MSEQNDEMLSTPTVAKRLGVTPRTIQRWCAQGKIPGAQKVNPAARRSPYVIPASAVSKLLQQRTAESNGNDKPN